MIRLFCVSAVIIAVVLLQSSAWATSPDPSHLSADPRVRAARAMVEAGRFEEALHALRPLAPDHPDRTDVLFLIGLAAIEASGRQGLGGRERTELLAEAIMAFRAILVDRPGLVRVRLELARAYFLNGDHDLSRRHFEYVLATGPPPAVVANVRQFLVAMEARRRWSSHVGLSIASDSNVGAASDADTIYIFGLPFRRDAGSGATSGTGLHAWGGGEYRHPLSRRQVMRAGFDVSHREYPGGDFDQTSLSVHAGPRWLVGEDAEVSVLANARGRWMAGEPHSRGLGIQVEAERNLASGLKIRALASGHRRTFPRNGQLNGSHHGVSLSGTWLTTPTMQTTATIGHSWEHTRALRWRNSGFLARVGSSFALERGFTLGLQFELRKTRYQGNWFPFTPGGIPRRDQIRTLEASILNRALTANGFSPQLVLVNETRKSNAQLYDYKRNRLEVQFVRQF
ncbi:MAG: porin family protein [Rhodobacteraceae bacterium]|nr:porin family protein [Paracoccaceae bacterium]MCY4137956.1 porin family protein [Paracoccaceae bacterium]